MYFNKDKFIADRITYSRRIFYDASAEPVLHVAP